MRGLRMVSAAAVAATCTLMYPMAASAAPTAASTPAPAATPSGPTANPTVAATPTAAATTPLGASTTAPATRPTTSPTQSPAVPVPASTSSGGPASGAMIKQGTYSITYSSDCSTGTVTLSGWDTRAVYARFVVGGVTSIETRTSSPMTNGAARFTFGPGASGNQARSYLLGIYTQAPANPNDYIAPQYQIASFTGPTACGTAAGAPTLSLQASASTTGCVATGSTADVVVAVRNTSTLPVEATAIVTAGGWDGTPPPAKTLAPGESTTMTLPRVPAGEHVVEVGGYNAATSTLTATPVSVDVPTCPHLDKPTLTASATCSHGSDGSATFTITKPVDGWYEATTYTYAAVAGNAKKTGSITAPESLTETVTLTGLGTGAATITATTPEGQSYTAVATVAACAAPAAQAPAQTTTAGGQPSLAETGGATAPLLPLVLLGVGGGVLALKRRR